MVRTKADRAISFLPFVALAGYSIYNAVQGAWGVFALCLGLALIYAGTVA